MKLHHGPMTRKLAPRFCEHPAFPFIIIGGALAALLLMAIYNL